PTAVLDLVLESDPEAGPSEAPLSTDYVPNSPIYTPASPDYHPGSDTQYKPFEAELEESSEDDASEAAKPLPA
ncbi:hypothetical protein Tco_0817255, partial [Tanacetum coccineum]